MTFLWHRLGLFYRVWTRLTLVLFTYDNRSIKNSYPVCHGKWGSI